MLAALKGSARVSLSIMPRACRFLCESVGRHAFCRMYSISLTHCMLSLQHFFDFLSFTGSALKSSASNDASMKMETGMGVNGFGRTCDFFDAVRLIRLATLLLLLVQALLAWFPNPQISFYTRRYWTSRHPYHDGR